MGAEHIAPADEDEVEGPFDRDLDAILGRSSRRNRLGLAFIVFAFVVLPMIGVGVALLKVDWQPAANRSYEIDKSYEIAEKPVPLPAVVEAEPPPAALIAVAPPPPVSTVDGRLAPNVPLRRRPVANIVKQTVRSPAAPVREVSPMPSDQQAGSNAEPAFAARGEHPIGQGETKSNANSSDNPVAIADAEREQREARLKAVDAVRALRLR